MNYFSSKLKTKVLLRSKSTEKINEQLTKKQLKKLELGLFERNQNGDPAHSTGSSERDSDFDDINESKNPRQIIDLKQFSSSNGEIIQCKGQQNQQGQQGENVPQPQGPQQPTTNTQQRGETRSLPEKSNQSSSAQSTNPKFRIDEQNNKEKYDSKYGKNFSEDSLQLEALFYQLSKHNFQRTPITQCSPILAYYLFSMLVLYKQTDKDQLNPLIISDVKVDEIFNLIHGATQQRVALDLFLRQSESQGLKEEAKQVILRRQNVIDEIEQKGEGSLNYQLVIDDFLMYQNLYKEKEQQIQECIQKNKYGKNNICIGYLRFVFYEVIENKPFFIRLPIGQFNDQQVVQQESFKIDDQFLEENQLFKFTKKSKTMHSEILLFIWIAQNKQQIANLLTQQLNEKYANNFQMPSQLYLKEVYLEITSEKRVCQECVDTFPQFPTCIISDDFAAKMISNLFTVQVCFDFRLVIVSQYLFIQKGVKREQKPVQCKGNDALPNNKEIIYFEMDDYVGIMTKEYLIKRYMSSQKQSLFTQRIDQIKPTNTFFLSQFIEDNSKNSSQKASKKVVQYEITLNRLDNANIYIPLVTAMSQIQWVFQFQVFQQYLEPDIQQQQTLLCYQLIKSVIKIPISHQGTLYLISPAFLQLLLRQIILKKGILEEIQTQFCHLGSLAARNQIDLSELENSKQEENFMNRKNLFNLGYINVRMLLLDYHFMKIHSSNQSQNFQQVDYNQPNLTNNFGLIKINLILQDSNQQISQEVLDIQINKINNDFFIQLTQQFQQRQYQLQQYEIEITQVLCFIITMQQLSKEYKQLMEQQLHLGIQIEFYYQYFRKRLPLSQEVYKNEEQYIVFNTKNLETRYSKANADSQDALLDMDANISKRLINFDKELFQENQQLEQQVQ